MRGRVGRVSGEGREQRGEGFWIMADGEGEEREGLKAPLLLMSSSGCGQAARVRQPHLHWSHRHLSRQGCRQA
eukprot:6539479-Pyramimonas_sp.AAC.1